MSPLSFGHSVHRVGLSTFRSTDAERHKEGYFLQRSSVKNEYFWMFQIQ